MDIGDLTSIIGSTATGGVLGGLFSMGSAAVEYVSNRAAAKEALANKKADQGHELAILSVTHDRARQEHEESVTVTRLQAQIDEVKMSFDNLATTVNDQTVLSGRVDGVALDVLALFRPCLTILLVGGTITLGVLQEQFAFEQVSLLTAMAVSWWFGDRYRSKVGK